MSAATGWKVAAGVLFLCCILLVYRVIDQAITLSYSSHSQEDTSRDYRMLRALLEREWIGLPEEKITLRLKAYIASQPTDSIIVLKHEPETGDVLFESLRLVFREGKLIKVT